MVFSDLAGDQVIALYKQFRRFGITADILPLCTPITTEQEILAMGAENALGHNTSFNDFQDVDSPENDNMEFDDGKITATVAAVRAAGGR